MSTSRQSLCIALNNVPGRFAVGEFASKEARRGRDHGLEIYEATPKPIQAQGSCKDWQEWFYCHLHPRLDLRALNFWMVFAAVPE